MTKSIVQHVDGGMRIVGPGRFDVFDIGFTVSAEGDGAADAVDVTIQLKDAEGKAIHVPNVLLYVYLTADTAGNYAVGTAVTTLAEVDATLLVHSVTTGLIRVVITNSSGQVVMRATIAGSSTTRRMAVIGPSGRVSQSGTMTWAA